MTSDTNPLVSQVTGHNSQITYNKYFLRFLRDKKKYTIHKTISSDAQNNLILSYFKYSVLRSGAN